MLGLSPLPRNLDAALRDSKDKKTEVRVSAIRDLTRHAREGERARAVAGLLEVLEGDKMPGVRAEAAIALADAEAREGIAALTRAAAHDEAVRVRQMALVALGEVATPDDLAACQTIEQALEDRSPELRFQALIAFSRVAGPASAEVLYACMADEDAHIRYVAFRLAEERWVGENTEPSTPPRLLERAREAIDDDAPEVRLAAAILLARSGDRSGEGVLVAAVEKASGAHEPEDEAAAIELSGELGLAAARRGLERRAFGVLGLSRDSFAWQARIALARLGDARAKSHILRGLGAWTRDARTVAVAAAGRARLVEARPLIAAMRGHPDRAEPDAVEEALQLLPEP